MAEAKISGLGELSCAPLPATEAITLYADLMRVVGKASGRLPAIIMGMVDEDERANFHGEMQAIQGIIDILSGTSSDEVTALIKRVVEIAHIRAPSGDIRPLDLDGDFTNKLALIFPVVRFVLEAQFRDFFTASVGSGIRSVLSDLSRRDK